MGLLFQIQDDYMNLQSEEVRLFALKCTLSLFNFGKKYAENKSFCEDFTEGKFSFPIIHSIRSNQNDYRLISWFLSIFIQFSLCSNPNERHSETENPFQ